MNTDPVEFLNGKVKLYPGDCLKVLSELPEASVDSVVTDPPYHLNSIVQRFGAEDAAPAKSNGATGVYARSAAGFMGKQWDGGDIAFRPETWAAVLRVLKPGGHLLAFAAPRNQHRMICAIEDAGFEIRDCLQWIFGQGFPKNHNAERGVAAATCKLPGRHFEGSLPHPEKRRPGDHVCPMTQESQPWEGWGTALKPAYEPICLARRPLIGTVAANVLAHGTGALNIDGCRMATGDKLTGSGTPPLKYGGTNHRPFHDTAQARGVNQSPLGRWPANIIHDGSDEVTGLFPETGTSSGGSGAASQRTALAGEVYGKYSGATLGQNAGGLGDSGSAARFFYTAKADSAQRVVKCLGCHRRFLGKPSCGCVDAKGKPERTSGHPTVKPVSLMRYLVRLVTPPGGVCLDPFAGTGTTGQAAWIEGCNAILVELDEEYLTDLAFRMESILTVKPRRKRPARTPLDLGPLFKGAQHVEP